MGVHIRRLQALCAGALVMATCAPVYADLATPRVRPVGHRMVSLLDRGRAASRTFALLVDSGLEWSDVIVYIAYRCFLEGPRIGETLFVTAADVVLRELRTFDGGRLSSTD